MFISDNCLQPVSLALNATVFKNLTRGIYIHIMSRSKYKDVLLCDQSSTAAQAIELCHVAFHRDILASRSKIKGCLKFVEYLSIVEYFSIRCCKSYILDT